MKTIHFLMRTILIFSLVGCSEKLHELTVDASSGKTAFKTSKNNGETKKGSIGNEPNLYSSQYIRKGKAFNVKMSNISQNDSLVITVSEQDVHITGDDPNRFPDSLFKITSASKSMTAENIEEQEQILKNLDAVISQIKDDLVKIKSDETNYNRNVTDINKKKLTELKKQSEKLESEVKKKEEKKKEAQKKLDSLKKFASVINYVQKEIHQLSLNKNHLKNNAQKDAFLKQLEIKKIACEQMAKIVADEESEFLSLASELHQSLGLFYVLKLEVENLVFEKEQVFFPSKEEFTVSIKKYQRNNRNSEAVTLTQLTFIQYKRFKIFSSVGAHCMIYNGKYAGIYDNKDSLIVRRNGSNIVPSFGTYLNGTWRLNDCLMGIGLGMGIPLQLTDNVDMTPNFNILWTTNFQNQYGRFGINAGFGIQKVNVLSPGFKEGDNLGTSNLDVPLKAIWTPTFGVGISYNIGERE